MEFFHKRSMEKMPYRQGRPDINYATATDSELRGTEAITLTILSSNV